MIVHGSELNVSSGIWNVYNIFFFVASWYNSEQIVIPNYIVKNRGRLFEDTGAELS